MELLTPDAFKLKVFDYEKNKEWKFAGELPSIVDFYADWCGPCRMLSPVLEEISREYQGKINIYKVDTEKHPELAALFRVRGIPTLIFIPMDDKPTTSSGFLSKEVLRNIIQDVLKV